MTMEEKRNRILEAMIEVEEDIKVLQNNIEKARKYLTETEADKLDADYFDECLDIEKGLKHISLF